MSFDVAQVIDDVKSQLTTAEADNSKKINTALGLCLEDLTTRMQSDGMLVSDTDSVTAGTRSHTVTGEKKDVRYIYVLKWGTGDDQKVLYYKPPKYFLEKYDNPSQSTGIPTYYTVLLNDIGNPIIKFDCPTSATDTLTVYYFKNATPQTIGRFRSEIVLVMGTLAYFYGRTTEKGKVLYEDYKEAVKLAREADPFLAQIDAKFQMCKYDREVRDIIWALRDRRY